MTTSLKCSQCGTSEIDLVDNRGWPLYYFGAGPNNPQDAEVYFCGAICANKYHKEQQNGT